MPDWSSARVSTFLSPTGISVSSPSQPYRFGQSRLASMLLFEPLFPSLLGFTYSLGFLHFPSPIFSLLCSPPYLHFPGPEMPQVPFAPHPILCPLLLLSHIGDPLSNVFSYLSRSRKALPCIADSQICSGSQVSVDRTTFASQCCVTLDINPPTHLQVHRKSYMALSAS